MTRDGAKARVLHIIIFLHSSSIVSDTLIWLTKDEDIHVMLLKLKLISRKVVEKRKDVKKYN